MLARAAIVAAALSALARASSCGLYLGVVVETSNGFYSFEHVPNIVPTIGCVSQLIDGNAFPAASTPAVSSVSTDAFKYVATLAYDPNNNACGIRLLQPQGATWNLTFAPEFSYFCPPNANSPSPVLALDADAANVMAVVAVAGSEAVTRYVFNWDGSVVSAIVLQGACPGKPTAAYATLHDGSFFIAKDAGVTCFYPVPVNRSIVSSSLPAGVIMTQAYYDVKLDSPVAQYALANKDYSVDCLNAVAPAPPADAPVEPITGGNPVFALRAAYDAASHNYWQFTSDATLVQYAASACPLAAVHTYTVPASQPLPWNAGSNVAVYALPPAGVQ